MINLGIDARRAFNDLTGLGNYSRNLISFLSNSDFNCYLFGVKNPNVHFDYQKDRFKIISPPKYLDERFWKQLGINYQIKKSGLHIYHGLSNEIPFFLPKKIKTVVSIHDLFFLDYPHHYKLQYRSYYNLKFRHSANSSDRIVAMSSKTKNDLIKYYQIKESKIDVILQGCNAVFKKKYSEQEKAIIKARYKLPEKFILFVGSVQERKNILSVLKAIKGMDIKFVVVSNRKTDYLNKVLSFIKENEMQENVHFRNVELNIDLAMIYQLSQAFVFPSLNEGFGIPILESLSGGVPVIANDIEVFHEVGGKHCYYVDVEKDTDFRDVIEHVWNNREIPNSNELESFLDRYSDMNILKQYTQIYNRLA